MFPLVKYWNRLRSAVGSLLSFRSTSDSQAAPNITTAPRLREWDKGVFVSELIKQSIFPRALKAEDDGFIIPSNALAPLAEGTFQGSKKAATEMYQRIEQRCVSIF